MSTVLDFIAKRGIQSAYSASTYAKGKDYYQSSRVSGMLVTHPSDSESLILAKVKGRVLYQVSVRLLESHRNINLQGSCSCPMQRDCKHVVATLLQAMDSRSTHSAVQSTVIPVAPSKSLQEQAIESGISQWLAQLQGAMKASIEPEKDPAYSLYYLLAPRGGPYKELQVALMLVRHLKTGGFGVPKSFSRTAYSNQKYLYPIDKELFVKLDAVNQLSSQRTYYSNVFALSGDLGDALLPELLNTGRVYWGDLKGHPLSTGERSTAELSWQVDVDGAQKPIFLMKEAAWILFFIGQTWYYDSVRSVLGHVQTGLDPKISRLLLLAPKVPPEQAKTVSDFLSQHTGISEVPPPKILTKKTLKKCAPVPCLRLFETHLKPHASYYNEGLLAPVAALSFDYQGEIIPWHLTSKMIQQVQEDLLISIERSPKKESHAVSLLEQASIFPISRLPQMARANPDQVNHFLLEHSGSDPLMISAEILPKLRALGWRITFDPDYSYQIIDDPIDDWYTDIEEEASGYDWFGLELGVMVKGEKINLLPVLQHVLQQAQGRAQLEGDDIRPVYAQLENGHYIPLPTDRVKSILRILIELYDNDSLSESDQLRLSMLHAARLLELEAALGAAKLRWFGGDRIREIAQKLTQFKGIEAVSVPETFLGELRPYQLEGLHWLQFLREYEFGGILADDMGLGKTVQALAHITLEKTSGRLQHPCLVIAPTSLMFNWQMEAKRFSPELRVLLLHGAERKELFESLSDCDLILTTYPLIVRDKAVLLKQQFHLLILDEAQCIKNAKSLVTQVAIQLKAKHRLCLTGTPMENHLGELWSLYHFMMPGLLGEQKAFTRTFRTPIEKQGNQARRDHLNKRIAPFLLRRTKDKVVKELPEKVEMIRHVELEGAQRDLYETIRVTMQEKITQEIAKLGLARSHIIILDALLKLRQVCCDPRLLKIKTSKKTVRSAKLELLMTLIPELLEEGRRILLFSQFTEMLALIEDALNKVNITYVKLTGQTKDRATPVQQFQNEEVPLFLISLKAGGTGLNLTAADTVIHYDPWWNPAVEHQATDRAHRIGQNKTVFVYKLVVKETVEEKILEMQARKYALMEGLFSDKTTEKSALTEQDLRGLFAPLAPQE